MASNAAGLAVPGFAHNISSKMAVIGLTGAWRIELAEPEITANAIAPSLVRTPTTEAGPAALFDIVPEIQAIKRVELPSDLGGTLTFVVSDTASFLTGQTSYVDGGLVRAA